MPEHFDADLEKRNSGRTGPTSPEGRATSSQNAVKHGACSQTLILPGESEDSWLLLLSRWCETYNPLEDSLEYDFVLRTAQAEWRRIRAQRNYDAYLSLMGGFAPFEWTPAEIKTHDLMLRYRTAAERAFQREYRLLEQHYKSHPPAIPEIDRDNLPTVHFVLEESKYPSGNSPKPQHFGGREQADESPPHDLP